MRSTSYTAALTCAITAVAFAAMALTANTDGVWLFSAASAGVFTVWAVMAAWDTWRARRDAVIGSRVDAYRRHPVGRDL